MTRAADDSPPVCPSNGDGGSQSYKKSLNCFFAIPEVVDISKVAIQAISLPYRAHSFAEAVVRMASPSNNTRQGSLSNPVDTPSSPTEQGPQMESDTPSCALDGQPGETSSSGANAEARSYGSESRGENATSGPPGTDGFGYPPGGQPPQQNQEDSFWVCCGGVHSICPRNGVWLRANTPACLDCEHRVCPNCELKQTE
ncbi:unnamed protein product [Tuber aestivum]|uniref:Uncharacterized protein n=1 Tax=Tuber aestivum TaxID=59557 RepID=A0A292Q5U3_9PEZI|nr:unnamed protein product [Tuber aestivum]